MFVFFPADYQTIQDCQLLHWCLWCDHFAQQKWRSNSSILGSRLQQQRFDPSPQDLLPRCHRTRHQEGYCLRWS